MSDLDHAKALFAMAKKDWQALQEMSRNLLIADEILGFHAQQAIEKSLKAWIASLGLDYPRTHNLISLLDKLEEHGGAVERFWDLTAYNSYAVQFRYETLEPEGESLDRPGTLRQVAVLVDFVERLLSGDAT